jgi:hypothetical protein
MFLTQTNPMLGIIEARARSEPEDEFQRGPGLTASEMVRLLEEYRANTHPSTLDRLAVEYDVDRAALGRLVQYVSVPDEQPVV